jgi:hypothetical protein
MIQRVLDLDGYFQIILESILGKYCERGCGVDSSGSGYGPVADPYKHGNEPSVSTKGKGIS